MGQSSPLSGPQPAGKGLVGRKNALVGWSVHHEARSADAASIEAFGQAGREIDVLPTQSWAAWPSHPKFLRVTISSNQISFQTPPPPITTTALVPLFPGSFKLGRLIGED